MPASSLETIVQSVQTPRICFPVFLCVRGLGSTWDYGPLGVELKNNVKRAWCARCHERDDMEGLDAAILMNRLVWKYSGHEATFSDPMMDCRACKARPRADHVFVAQKGRDPTRLGSESSTPPSPLRSSTCPKCGSKDSDRGPAFQPDVPHQQSARWTPATSRDWSTYAPRKPLRVSFVNFGQRARYHAGASYPLASPRWARPSATKSRRAISLSHARIRANGD